MSLSTYTEISTAIAQWLNREGMTEVTDKIEDMVALAQRRIHRECEFDAMLEVTPITIDAQTVAVPVDFLKVRSLTISQGINTDEVMGAPLTEVLGHTYTGRPITYRRVGDNFYFGPTPDQSYSGTLVYVKSLPILSSNNESNWFSTNAPDLIMWATMVEACLFLKDDNRAQVWEARFMQVKDDIESLDRNASREPGGLRVRAR